MNQVKSGFEDISFNPFNKSDSLFDDLTQHENLSLSLLHFNIRSLRSNLDDFHILLSESKYSFNVFCLTETWLNDHELKTNSNYHLPNYEGIPYEKKLTKEGGGFFCILGMILPIKFETICLFLMAIEKSSQLNYLQKVL